jgi:hypothetical protein
MLVTIKVRIEVITIPSRIPIENETNEIPVIDITALVIINLFSNSFISYRDNIAAKSNEFSVF